MTHDLNGNASSSFDDSLWGGNPDDVVEAEWTNISSNFTNAGYREGITSGKEGALQEGFDAGYAGVGFPLGHTLGLMRGRASAIAAFLSQQTSPEAAQYSEEARKISHDLGRVRFADVVPRDEEAEAHALEHLAMTGEHLDENEEIKQRKAVEQLEDLMRGVSTDTANITNGEKRPTRDDVSTWGARLHALSAAVGIVFDPQRI